MSEHIFKTVNGDFIALEPLNFGSGWLLFLSLRGSSSNVELSEADLRRLRDEIDDQLAAIKPTRKELDDGRPLAF